MRKLQNWCQRPGLNRRPKAYESSALPLSYSGVTAGPNAWQFRGCGKQKWPFWMPTEGHGSSSIRSLAPGPAFESQGYSRATSNASARIAEEMCSPAFTSSSSSGESFGSSPFSLAWRAIPKVPHSGRSKTSAQRRAARSSRTAVNPGRVCAQPRTSLSPRPKSHEEMMGSTFPTSRIKAAPAASNHWRARSSAGPSRISNATPAGITISSANWLNQSRRLIFPRQINGDALTTHLLVAAKAMAKWTLQDAPTSRARSPGLT